MAAPVPRTSSSILCKKNTELHVSLLSMRTRRFEVGDLGYEQDVVSIIRHGSSGRHQVRCPGGDTEEIEEHMLDRQCPRLASTADFREAAAVLQVLLKRCTEAFTTMLLYPRSWARYQVTIGAVCERAGPAHVASWLSVLLTGTCLNEPHLDTTHKFMYNPVGVVGKLDESTLDGIKHSYVAVARVVWKFDTLHAMNDTLTIAQAVSTATQSKSLTG